MSTYKLVYDDAPASVNAGGGGARANHFAAHREKKKWEGIFWLLLLTEKVPKPLSHHVRITIELQFRQRRNRDAENLRHPIVKPLLDAMVRGGWLLDDTEEHVEVERLYILDEPLRVGRPIQKRLTVTIQVADEE